MFQKIPGVTEEIAQNLVSNGYLSLDGIGASEASDIANIDGIDEELAEVILNYAKEKLIS
jgi:transcription termination factor NusA